MQRDIEPYVDDFIRFAIEHPQLTFLVTRIGCGIAGFKDEEIAPLFKGAIEIQNVILPRRIYSCFIVSEKISNFARQNREYSDGETRKRNPFAQAGMAEAETV